MDQVRLKEYRKADYRKQKNNETSNDTESEKMIKNVGLTTRRKGVATLFPVVKSNPYRKFVLKHLRNIEKRQNLREERLEKESEEEIMRIATNFCKEVQAWDEADAVVTDAVSLSASDCNKKVDAEALNLEISVLDEESHVHFTHLSDPVWVAKLFRVDFNPLWMQGFTRELEAVKIEDPIYDSLQKYEKDRVENEGKSIKLERKIHKSSFQQVEERMGTKKLFKFFQRRECGAVS